MTDLECTRQANQVVEQFLHQFSELHREALPGQATALNHLRIALNRCARSCSTPLPPPRLSCDRSWQLTARNSNGYNANCRPCRLPPNQHEHK